MQTKRKLSEHAQVAKLCREYCKSIGVKAFARSSSFSMGDSVSVEVENQPPAIMKQIEENLSKYQYGSFNGMEDIYEHTNNRDDIPQTKYLSIDNRFTPDMYQAAYRFIVNKYPANCAGFPEDYESARNLRVCDGSPHYMDINHDTHKLLAGSDYGLDKKNSDEFWSEYLKASTQKAEVININRSAVSPAEGMTIREGTKPGYSEILFSDKPDEETRNTLKSAGFRWSRHNGCWWGKTENLPFTPDDEPTPPTSGPRKPDGDKFRAMADKIEPQIADKLAPRQENTAKRQAQAAHARLEGERLKRTQAALYALADMHDSGAVPPVLSTINSKKAVYDLMSERLASVSNGFHGYHIGTGEIHDTNRDNPQAVALWELLTPKSDEEKKAEELAQMVRDVKNTKIPGYFPTPGKIIDLMIDRAALQDFHAVLEPSAGSGAICDRLQAELSEHGTLDCVECNYTLSDILNHKGYRVTNGDFLLTEFSTEFDRVLMNPPFENLQDCDHVRHAFKSLKNGGRLVAIMSPSFQFNSSKKAESFRDWLESKPHEIIDIDSGEFKESGTMVATRLLIVDKD